MIETIQHAEQRYETVGDWWFDLAGDLHIQVSDMGNWKYEALVAFHELVEVLLCKARGITTAMVDDFDKTWEPRRDGDVEPGDDPGAPYRKEHVFASILERMLGVEFGVEWDEYDAAVKALWR